LQEGWIGRHWSCESETEFARERFAKSLMSLLVSFFGGSVLGEMKDWLVKNDRNHYTLKTWRAVKNCCEKIIRLAGDTDFVMTRAAKDSISDLAEKILQAEKSEVAKPVPVRIGRSKKTSYQSEIAEDARTEKKANTSEEEWMKQSTKEEKQQYLIKVAKALQTSKRAVEVVERRDMEFIEALENMEVSTDPDHSEYVNLATGYVEKTKSIEQEQDAYDESHTGHLEEEEGEEFNEINDDNGGAEKKR